MDQRRTSKNKTTTLSCNSQTKRLTLAGCCHSSVVAVVTIILTASLFLAKQHQNKIAAVVQVQAFPQKILSFRPRRSGGPHQQQQTRHHHHNKCRCPNVAVAFASSAGPSASTTRIESSDDDNDVMAEEQMRWDRLYEQGQTGSTQENSKVNNNIGRQTVCEVRVVTFDLDNTLWNTTATIDAANNVLRAYMDESLPGNILRTEKVMGTLFRANKARYCPMELDQAKSPVLLTQLRKDAIRHVYSEHYGGNHSDGSNITSFVETAFDVWAQARHDAIPLHLAQSVTDSLRMVQSLREGSSQRIVVGAITDGNANLMVIPELAKFFDFCVHAETVGIGKPDKRVYLHAVARALQHPSLHDLLLDASVAPPGTAERDQVGTVTTTLTEDQCEELAGPWWVHVGDDFVKDIVAAKNLNMRSIWARELIRDQIAGPSTTVTPKNERTVEELVQVLAEMKVVEMQVGADSYLADSLQKEFADAIADEFGSVADILHRWQREATTVVDSSRHSAVRQTGPPMVAEEAVSDQLPPADAKANDSRQPDTKFCIVCGTKLPVAAIFCSACGEKQ